MTDLFIWAHRGASARAPENTLAAFRMALEDGADGLELDVHLTRDGVPVVIHDETVDRTTDGTGQVRELDWQEISGLDAGTWFDQAFAGEAIPALVEVFQWNDGRLDLNVEIKEPSAGRAVLEIWRRFPANRLVVSSFDHDLLKTLHRLEPELPLGFLVETGDWQPAVERAVACRARCFNPRQDLVDRPMVEACNSLGLALYPWTVDGPVGLERLRELGVDGVFCNDPRRARNLLARAGV